ncbi:MAG TPA: hypothetical protein VLF18_10510 [Tahibacter sp.]|uniref:hypothetical protein n=1 Tax=Tahibacter sp. TaxID=2056211 RepID=UPI002CC7C1BB|nr:hypothetical protein [Tahibacter sp.]HSX60620.1 hypothetical protein [Tahibacter sp.]
MPNREFIRDELMLDGAGCYSWRSDEDRGVGIDGEAGVAPFNSCSGDDVLGLLNHFARDKPEPSIAFAVGELILAHLSGGTWTRAQVLDWLTARWYSCEWRSVRALQRSRSAARLKGSGNAPPSP